MKDCGLSFLLREKSDPNAESRWVLEAWRLVRLLISSRGESKACIALFAVFRYCLLNLLTHFHTLQPPPLLPGIIIAWAFCPSPAPLSFYIFLLLFSKKCRKWFEWHIYMWAGRIQRIAINPSFLESQLVPDNLGLEIFRDHLKGVT